jgi:hypothetical protein
MENPTTWRDFRLSSPGLDRTVLMVGNGAKRIRAFHIHSIRSSGTRRLSPSGRWLEWRFALIRFVPSTNINTVDFIASELRGPSRRVVGFQLEIRF